MDLERLGRTRHEFAPPQGEIFSIALAAAEDAAGKRAA
jgi:hypothetical protein